MPARMTWRTVAGELEAKGVSARLVPAERLDDLRERFGAAYDELAPSVAAEVDGYIDFELPAEVPAAPSLVVAAVSSPCTPATFVWGGEEHTFPVPPTYADAGRVWAETAVLVGRLLGAAGAVRPARTLPLKLLAACAGLTRYGRNNIAYAEGRGSYLRLAAFVCDLEPALDSWGEPQALERCAACDTCARICPTAAVAGDRFLLHAERCLTHLNEGDAPFPNWVDPAWHECPVGCMKCQRVCPENARPGLRSQPPERFDEAETMLLLEGAPVEDRPAATHEKLARCGLDLAPELLARNLRVLL